MIFVHSWVHSKYMTLRDKLTSELLGANKLYKNDERFEAIKDKFVDMNNVANWVWETSFDNPNANLYQLVMEKIVESRRAKRAKIWNPTILIKLMNWLRLYVVWWCMDMYLTLTLMLCFIPWFLLVYVSDYVLTYNEYYKDV